MAAQADIVINDGQASPVAHTFSKRGATSVLATYKDISGGIPIGYPMITVGFAQTGPARDSVWKTDARIVLPSMEVISGSDGGYTPRPKVAYSHFARIELVSPNRSSLQERKDIVAYAKNLLALAVILDGHSLQDIPT